MRFFSWHLDFLGFSASFLCAVHCLALPFLLSFGLLTGLAWLHQPLVEWGMILLAVTVAGWALLRSYRSRGGGRGPLIAGALGIIALATGRVAPGEAEHYLTALGGFFLAYAHFINWKMTTACEWKAPGGKGAGTLQALLVLLLMGYLLTIKGTCLHRDRGEPADREQMLQLVWKKNNDAGL